MALDATLIQLLVQCFIVASVMSAPGYNAPQKQLAATNKLPSFGFGGQFPQMPSGSGFQNSWGPWKQQAGQASGPGPKLKKSHPKSASSESDEKGEKTGWGAKNPQNLGNNHGAPFVYPFGFGNGRWSHPGQFGKNKGSPEENGYPGPWGNKPGNKPPGRGNGNGKPPGKPSYPDYPPNPGKTITKKPPQPQCLAINDTNCDDTENVCCSSVAGTTSRISCITPTSGPVCYCCLASVVGHPCTQNSDCCSGTCNSSSGVCAAGNAGALCTASTDCANGLSCKQSPDNPEIEVCSS